MKIAQAAVVVPLLAILCATGVVVSEACSSSSSSAAFSPPSSAKPIAVGGGTFGTCDTVNGYAYATEAICGFSCPSHFYYILCNGSTYTECDCSEPGGNFTVIEDPSDGLTDSTTYEDASSSDSTASDSSTGDSGTFDGGACVPLGGACADCNCNCCRPADDGPTECDTRYPSTTSQCFAQIGTVCTSDDECPTNNCGSDGKCALSDLGGDCVLNEDCSSGTMFCDKGVCAEAPGAGDSGTGDSGAGDAAKG
jgi:hypothetical protein